LQPRGQENKHPIFVLAAARSGTTLLRYALDAHPRIAVPPEWNFTQPIVAGYAHFERLVEQGDGDDRSRPFRRIGIDCSATEVRARFRSWLECWYLEYAKRRGKARWGATTHTLLDYSVGVVDDLFAGCAAYVVQVRHPLDQVTSAIEKFGDGEFSALNLTRHMDYWVRVVSQHLVAEEQLGERCTRIRYEDLVADPTLTANRVFAFLGEDPVPDIATLMFTERHDGHWGDHKILSTDAVHTTSVGRWKAVLDRTIVNQTLAAVPAAAELMIHLGYSLD
jgi:protein-tyrosine sulfotransferase